MTRSRSKTVRDKLASYISKDLTDESKASELRRSDAARGQVTCLYLGIGGDGVPSEDTKTFTQPVEASTGAPPP